MAREAVDAFRETDFLVFQGTVRTDLADVLRLLGRQGDAIPMLDEAARIFERKGATVLARRAQTTLDRLRHERGDTTR